MVTAALPTYQVEEGVICDSQMVMGTAGCHMSHLSAVDGLLINEIFTSICMKSISAQKCLEISYMVIFDFNIIYINYI